MNKLIVKLWIALLMTSSFLLMMGCSPQAEETPSQQEDQETYTISAASFLPATHPLLAIIPDLFNEIENNSDGQLVIDFRGGPEVINAFDQIEAVMDGQVIDMTINVAGYYQAQMPEARSFPLSKLLPWEERESGLYDYYVELHKSLNMMYLGRWLTDGFYIWLKEPVVGPEGINRKNLRTSGSTFDLFVLELGATPIVISIPDMYSALERGVADGFIFPAIGLYDLGFHEVTPYVIKHPLWYSNNGTIVMNLDKYNALPDHLQKILLDTVAEFEHQQVAYFKEILEGEFAKLLDGGVQVIEFSPEVAENYVETAYRVEWEALAEEVPETTWQKLRELSE